MSVPRTVADVIHDHVTLEVEGIDRLYLNVYQPKLQCERGVASFFRFHHGHNFVSSVLMDPISKGFIRALEAFGREHDIPLFTFDHRQRKDDVAAAYRARCRGSEGILINDTRDFGIGKRLSNLAALRQVGFQANRRLLHVQIISQDCAVGEDAFRQLNEPVVVQQQRASALRFADSAVQALLSALLVFRLLPRGFSNRDLRDHWAPLIGRTARSMTQGQMSYHLRRLRLHGLIERLPRSHRYRVTNSGWRAAMFCTRTYNRLLRPGLAVVLAPETDPDIPLRRCFDRLDAAINEWIAAQKVPA